MAEKTKTMNSDPPESLFSSSFFLSFFLRISFYVYERTLERTAFFWTFETLLFSKRDRERHHRENTFHRGRREEEEARKKKRGRRRRRIRQRNFYDFYDENAFLSVLLFFF